MGLFDLYGGKAGGKGGGGGWSFMANMAGSLINSFATYEAAKAQALGYEREKEQAKIAALETELEGSPTLPQLHSALELEIDQEKPRKGIVERLQNAINDFGDLSDL